MPPTLAVPMLPVAVTDDAVTEPPTVNVVRSMALAAVRETVDPVRLPPTLSERIDAAVSDPASLPRTETVPIEPVAAVHVPPVTAPRMLAERRSRPAPPSVTVRPGDEAADDEQEPEQIAGIHASHVTPLVRNARHLHLASRWRSDRPTSMYWHPVQWTARTLGPSSLIAASAGSFSEHMP
jgi:hypothetical protein